MFVKNNGWFLHVSQMSETFVFGGGEDRVLKLLFLSFAGPTIRAGDMWLPGGITATANAPFAASIERQLMLVLAVLQMLFVTKRMYIDTLTL